MKKSHPQDHKTLVINKDGSLNIHRPTEPGKFFFDLHHYLLAISWPKFFLIFIGLFFSFNLLFGCLYFWAGPGALRGLEVGTELDRLFNCFFFSVRSLDGVSPVGIWPNALVMIENYLGTLTLVVATGLLYARFSRPNARVLFSDYAIINTYNNKPCLVFRVANERLNQIIEARMILSLTKNMTSAEGENSRKIFQLKLENDYSALFALSWTIRHFIDEESPLFGLDENALRESQAAIFASLSGIDETFSQTVIARSVYRFDEIVYNKRFKDILVWKNNKMHIDLKGLSDMQ